MAALRGLTLVCLLAAASLPIASGAKSPAIPTKTETAVLLAGDNFAELEARYGALQQGYKHKELSGERLRDAFRGFYATDASFAPHYAAWVKAWPTSYIAHLARGIYYKKVGLESRGGGFIAETNEQQLAGMKSAFDVADGEFRESLKLDDKPLLTYLHSIDVRNAAGDHDGVRSLLDQSISIDSKNVIVRQKYMSYLETRWGGSTTEMQAFLNECRQAQLAPADMNILEAMVFEDSAWVHRYREANVDAAVRDYRKAGRLTPFDPDCLTCGPYEEAGDTLYKAKRIEEALQLYSEALKANPNSIHALYNRGYIDLQLNHFKEAVPDFRSAANLGDVDSQETLGRMYLLGDKIPRDLDKAIVLLAKAADQGDSVAQHLLVTAQESKAAVASSVTPRE